MFCDYEMCHAHSVKVQQIYGLTLSSCSFVCAADRQKRMRPSIRGVAGKPTPTVAIFLVFKVRTTALQQRTKISV